MTKTKKTKRFLFYASVAIFIILSYVIILYAQGYKYSISQVKFLRTGAISLRMNVSARIFLDDKLDGSTSFFNNAYSIDRLLPGTYEISVQKNGFSSWEKTASVEEGFVVDFSAIILLPKEGEKKQKLFEEVALLFKNLAPIPVIQPKPSSSSRPKIKQSPSPSPSPTQESIQELYILDSKEGKLYDNTDGQFKEIANNVLGFRLSKNKNKIAWWNSNELWIVWLNDQNYQPFYKKNDKEMMTRFQIPIQNGAWFRDEDHVILELEQHDSRNRPYSIYRVIETDKRGGVNIVEL
ncbi:MAG: hypothetical protein A2817_01995 [Candidatus Yanofskybacteria bacterium RIFCSPHIGHO2_01_FULL_39_8b]|uniref:PEGA domain-containing protein n=1 Tax=Candidatus Yanofskybacteria bacterium RIFCSPHIGHO2_01_FULL_39_8b TaxID=1802659 RepID=A0A1F8E9X8_9BACT|nr:MAG: hypothetical protein A2817_01995 [Candidatus Yanofskybacteria bacterium RIFCSPHIGHO2_01_FULL_39_8b]